MKSYIKLLSAALLVAGATTQASASEYDVLIGAIRATLGKPTGQITGTDYYAVVGKLPKGTELSKINSRIQALDDLVNVSSAEVAQLEALGMSNPNATFLVEALNFKAAKRVAPITAARPSADQLALHGELSDTLAGTTHIKTLPPMNLAALNFAFSTIASSVSDVETLFKAIVQGVAPSGAFAPYAGVTAKAEIIANPEVALAKLLKAVYDAEIAGNAAVTDKTAMTAPALTEIDQAILVGLFSKLK